MFEDFPTKTEAREQAEDYATPLNKLIKPNDAQEGAESWDEVGDESIEWECGECANIIATEHDEMRNLIQDCAFRLWTDDLKRVSRDALGDVSDGELVHVYGIWPNDMNKWDAFEIAYEVFEERNTRIPPGYHDQAHDAVIQGLYEGTKPQ